MITAPPNDPMNLCLRSLDGLSVGDAFGQCFFSVFNHLPREGEPQNIPSPPWMWTDDTVMACGIVEVLQRRRHIDQDDLAITFAKRYMLDPDRGYGGGAKKVLVEIYSGTPWRKAAASVFGGGSFGNGSAMRIAPLGAYFADDIPALIDEARTSAEVTHAHPEGIAGAIAIALVAGFASNHAGERSPRLIRDFFEFILENTPLSQTRGGIEKAVDLPRTTDPHIAVQRLGNGSHITCPDTVPLCLWLAARHWTSYVDALWTTARALGDIDTNCAIVGGIVALSDPSPMPKSWLDARGVIPIEAKDG